MGLWERAQIVFALFGAGPSSWWEDLFTLFEVWGLDGTRPAAMILTTGGYVTAMVAVTV